MRFLYILESFWGSSKIEEVCGEIITIWNVATWLFFNRGKPERVSHINDQSMAQYMYGGGGTSVTCAPLYLLYTVCDMFQHQLRGLMKELLMSRVRMLQVWGSRSLLKAVLKEDGAIDQSVSVSEDKRDRRLHRTLLPSAIRVDLRLVAALRGQAIEWIQIEVVSCRDRGGASYKKRQGSKVSASPEARLRVDQLKN